MEIVEFVEMNLIAQRLGLLRQKAKLVRDEQLSEYPNREFTLSEIASMSNFIDTLRTVDRVYG